MGLRFGEQLRAERVERGLSEAELGKDLYPASYISLLETGRREPTPEVIQELARRLDLSPKTQEAPSQQVAHGSEYVLAALQAHQAWDQRDYAKAADCAAAAARSALEGKDDGAWWNMSYMQAECLMKQGQLAECQRILQHLLEHPIASESLGLAVQAFRMLSIVWHGLGQLDIAIEHAREAVRLGARLPFGSTLYIAALRSLIGPLAEVGRLDEAWDYCKVLETLIDEESMAQLSGEVEWVIGNVAFMRADPEEGVKHHERAAKLLSPANDFALWARFNKATAAVRLSGGIVEPETLAAIERAELALSIAGGSRREQLEVAFIRARWYYLDGQLPAAIELLEEIHAEKHVVGRHAAGEVALLYGQALKDLGHKEEALELFKEAREQFTLAMLPDRMRAADDAILEATPIE